VNIEDYVGFILPCMASESIVTPEEIEFVKEVVSKDKPIAAQVGEVQILSKAGVLKGKKFAFSDEKDKNHDMYPEFN
jgi:putative intracellular protease/amidase